MAIIHCPQVKSCMWISLYHHGLNLVLTKLWQLFMIKMQLNFSALIWAYQSVPKKTQISLFRIKTEMIEIEYKLNFLPSLEMICYSTIFCFILDLIQNSIASFINAIIIQYFLVKYYIITCSIRESIRDEKKPIGRVTHKMRESERKRDTQGERERERRRKDSERETGRSLFCHFPMCEVNQ